MRVAIIECDECGWSFESQDHHEAWRKQAQHGIETGHRPKKQIKTK